MNGYKFKVHKAELLLLRHRVLIAGGGALFLWVFSIALGLVLYFNVVGIRQQQQDDQKADSCVRLIKDNDLTQQKIAECNEKNRTKKSDTKFQFNPVNSDEEARNDSKSNSITIKEAPAKEPTITVVTPEPDDEPILPRPRPVQGVVREVETRISPITGLIECRVVGDAYWLLGDDC